MLLLTPALEAQAAAPPRLLPDGVYAVRRDGITMKAVLPLRSGESLVVHRHRYLLKGDQQPARFVVVRPAPDVALDLDGAPTAIKDGPEVVGIQLQLRPAAATALERLTRDRRGGQVAIVIGDQAAARADTVGGGGGGGGFIWGKVARVV